MRKILTTLLAVAMLAALMAGCTSAAPSASPAAATAKPADTAAADTADDAVEAATEPEGIDISKEVTLIMYVLGDEPSDLNRVYEEFNKLLKDRINATLKTNYLSWGDWQTKYALVLAAGESIDLMYTSDWAYYTTETAKGSFYELTDEFLQTYMPLSMASQHPASIKQATIGGKLFAMPKNLSGLEGESWVAIRKDLREKYGMDEIKNIEDLEAFYIKVTENENFLPYAASADGGFNAQAWRQPHQLYYLTNIDWCYQISGREIKAPKDFSEITYSWFRDDAMPYYELMKKWAGLNFWSKNAIANTEQVRDAFENGKSASLTWNPTIFSAGKNLRENNAEWDFEAIDINPGTIRKQSLYTNDAIAIAATSQNPERAAMFIDLVKNDLELHLALIGGIEGVHYVLEDGTRAPGPEADKYPWNPSTWCFNPAEDFLRTDVPVTPDQAPFEAIQKELLLAPDMAAFRFDVELVKNELAAINALRDEYRPMLQLGMVDDIDATVAEWKGKVEAAGLAAVEAELKKQYEAWYATLEY